MCSTAQAKPVSGNTTKDPAAGSGSAYAGEGDGGSGGAGGGGDRPHAGGSAGSSGGGGESGGSESKNNRRRFIPVRFGLTTCQVGDNRMLRQSPYVSLRCALRSIPWKRGLAARIQYPFRAVPIPPARLFMIIYTDSSQASFRQWVAGPAVRFFLVGMFSSSSIVAQGGEACLQRTYYYSHKRILLTSPLSPFCSVAP